MKIFLKNFIIFCVGFTLYQCIECIWKTIGPGMGGVECFLMGVLGGLSLLLVGGLNKKLTWEMPFWLQSIVGGLIIVSLEFVTGLIVNKWACPALGRPIVWDYSNIPGNILGQICPQFFAAWVVLAAICILVDDYLRFKIYGEDKPHYVWWWKK